MIPEVQPGPMSEAERFLFDVSGYLVIRNALTQNEVAECLAASERLHLTTPSGQWRQIGAAYEQESAFEPLIDHPSILPKARALLGDKFILQSSWCTLSPPHFEGQSLHQDGSAAYEFRRLALPTPLVQLRIGFFLTDQSQENMGNIVVVPGSHNSSMPLPKGLNASDIPISQRVTGKPGDALLFHQGLYHCGTANEMDHSRHIFHVVYAPPWLIPSDRKGNDPAFVARTTPVRRALLGEWDHPEQPYAMGYEVPPFD
jgi:ectoine hydroxylase